MSNTVSFRVLPWTSPEPGQGYLIRKQLSVISIKLQIFTLQSFSFLFPSCRKHSPQHFLKLPFFFFLLTMVLEELTHGMSEERPRLLHFCWTC